MLYSNQLIDDQYQGYYLCVLYYFFSNEIEADEKQTENEQES